MSNNTTRNLVFPALSEIASNPERAFEQLDASIHASQGLIENMEGTGAALLNETAELARNIDFKETAIHAIATWP